MDETPLLDSGGTVWDPAQHELVDCLWVASLRNRLLNQSLFVYRHRIHGSYVLASWTQKPAPGVQAAMMELEVFPKSPDSMDEKLLPKAEAIQKKMQVESEVIKECVRQEKVRRDRLKHLKEEALRHRADIVKFLRSRESEHNKDKKSIRDIETGATPWTTKELLEHETGRKIS